MRSLLANDDDPNGDSLAVSSFDTDTAEGGSVQRSGTALMYEPAPGFLGIDTFEYVVSDGEATDTAQVTVTVAETPPPPAGNVVQLGPGPMNYAGTDRADVYVVDAAADSSLAQLDRILDFDVAEGDRVDFRAAGWTEDDFIFRTFGYGTPWPAVRLDGPDGFSLRINESFGDLDGAFIFAGDTLV
jgi:hypothetical protein